jgi:hypothetical protein
MYFIMALMLTCLAISLLIVMRFTLLLRKNIMHNKCHTDNMKIEDLHGHTEPHI